jgi:methyl-accepting chemotaxis protein
VPFAVVVGVVPVSFLLDLKTGRKFALLGLLAALAILLPCLLFARLALQDHEFARRERDGVPVVASLYDVIRLTQEHRGLSNAVLAGNAGVAPRRAAKVAEVEQAMAVAAATLQAAALPDLAQAWAALAQDWRALAAEVASGRVDARQSFARHTALVDRELQTLSTVLDRCNWSLDPESHTYFAIIATAVEGLHLTERMGQLRGLGAGILSRRHITPDERLQIHALETLATESFSRSSAALDKARAAAVAYDQALAPLQQAVRSQLDIAIRLVHQQIVEAELDGDATRYFDTLSGVIQRQFELNRTAASLIEHSLGDRVAHVQRTMAGMGVALLVVAGLSALVALHVARHTTRRLQAAQRAADDMATGDLAGRIRATGRDELGGLMQALGRMQAHLSGIVAGVRANAQQVASASQQIAHGNDDLSARTEQQASALQQTAASMEQINGTIQQNADSARQANELAVGAAGIAERGGDVVSRVVDTMHGIAQSSHRIEEIIQVIDGIAFQTNILALNAAVEAARAGEQGRGFAVVAGEVRSLAQRSGQAAREVRSLIGASVEQVQAGTALADEAGRTMHEMLQAVHGLADIVARIAAASREQASGVLQVSQAVADMDNTTQQNAALVEQSAAAAQALREQAQQLVAAVEVFRVQAAKVPQAVDAGPVANDAALAAEAHGSAGRAG